MHELEQTSRLAVLMFTDVVGSGEMKARLGTLPYARLLERHDEIFRQLLVDCPSAQVLQDLGDGHFVEFRTVSDAVRFALRFQDALHREPWGAHPVRTRIGIHLGELTHLASSDGGRPKVVGIAADFTARLMSLACGGQVLLTRAAFDEARQFISEYPSTNGQEHRTLRWMAHGDYLFEGSLDPVQVFEVGGDGIAPLTPPRDREKARRASSDTKEQILGWRPAVGLTVPQRPDWRLERKLGEGAFGEVWLAQHQKLKQRRVFKFCFDIERLESFKRELTLFRLLRDALGDRRDISRLHDVCLDRPPYFLETEFAPGGNLVDWAAVQGGLAQIPLPARLEIVAQVCDAVAAAHSVGVLHKDIKPSNILMHSEPDGSPRPQLSDFGIGLLTDPSQLARRQITEAGFGTMRGLESSRGGTAIYSPPESLAGRPFTIQGDIYSLGVLLYQMTIGDFEQPLAPGWERHVDDELLREDIAACVDGDPSRRLSSASDLARRLRAHEQRRAQRAQEREAAVAHLRRRRLLRAAALVVAISIMIAIVSLGGYLRERDLRSAVSGSELMAREREHIAQLRLLDNLILAGDSLTQSQRYAEALSTYSDAWALAENLGENPIRAVSGLLQAMSESPPPLINRRLTTAVDKKVSPVMRVRVMPDGRTIVAGDQANSTLVFDFPIPHKRASLRLRGWGSGIAFTTDGKLCLTGSSGGELKLWDTTDWQSPQQAVTKAPFVYSLAISPDDSYAVSVGPAPAGQSGERIHFWSLDPLQEMRVIDVPESMYSAAFSPDGKLLATGGKKGDVYLWNLPGGEPAGRFTGHRGEVVGIAFTPGGGRLLTGSLDKTARLWEVSSKKELFQFSSHRGAVREVCISHNGRFGATAGSDGTIRCWDLANGAEVKTFSRHNLGAMSVQFLPDDSAIVSGGNNGRIAIWTTTDDAVPVLRHHSGRIAGIAILPDGLTAISASHDQAVQQFDLATGKILRTVKAPQAVSAIALAPDGTRALVGQVDGTLHALDLPDFALRPIALPQPPIEQRSATASAAEEQHRIGAIAISPTSTSAVIGSDGGVIRVVTLGPAGGGFARKVSGRVHAACYTPDGTHALVAVERDMHLIDVETGQTVREIPTATRMIASIDFAPDGRHVLTGSYDQLVRLWDIESGRNTRIFSGHTGWVHAVACYSDGRTLATASEDNTVRLWDVKAGKEARSFTGHDAAVCALAVSRSGQMIASGDVAGAIRLWDLSRPTLLRDLSRDIANLTEVLDEKPEDAEALMRLGRWYAFRGRHDWAIECLEQARSAGADISPLLLARSYWQINRPADAARQFQAAIDRNEAPAEYLRLCLAAVER